jgi:hypothetical protein
MSEQFQAGDWVTSYGKGIWQIYRVLRLKGIDPATGRPRDQISIFSKRFLSSSMKRSFSEESCHPSFVKKLDAEALANLDLFIKDNQALYRKFLEYKPKPLDAIFNARFGIPHDKTADEIAALIPKDTMLWLGEIQPLLESLGLDTTGMPSWTAQFVSPDHTCVDGYLAYRFNRILSS